MSSALEFFKNIPLEKVKEIAHEGRFGYKPDGKYRLHTVPIKVFGGYQILFFLYPGLAITKMLALLELPYDRGMTLQKSIRKRECVRNLK